MVSELCMTWMLKSDMVQRASRVTPSVLPFAAPRASR
jgi:hypothetical protein